MKKQIAIYKDIPIYWSNGIYSQAIDSTVVSTSFEKIIRWIDRMCGCEPKKWVVDSFIIGEITLNKPYQSN